jgi:ribonuclease P protein component
LRVRFLADGSSGEQSAAVGFAIGKKYGSAVERNRLRRRLRAAVSAATTPLTSGFYVISADPAAARAPFAELVTAIDGVATKVAQ